MSWRGCRLSTCHIPAKLPLADSELEFCILAFHAWFIQFFCWHDDCIKYSLLSLAELDLEKSRPELETKIVAVPA
jgi:hypothetical protein